MCFNSILIYYKITYGAVMKTTPLHAMPSFERSGGQCHRSASSLLAVITSHCLGAFPAKMCPFKSHMRQTA